MGPDQRQSRERQEQADHITQDTWKHDLQVSTPEEGEQRGFTSGMAITHKQKVVGKAWLLASGFQAVTE